MTAEQIIRQSKPNYDYTSYPVQIAGLLTAADQESQADWETYTKYKRQLNDIPLDPLIHMEISQRLAEIFDL